MDKNGCDPSRIVGVDASRNRSGGARAHLIGLLKHGDPRNHGIREVHLWSYRTLLDAVPEYSWLKKHQPPALAGTIMRQLFWQCFQFPREAHAVGAEIILNTDAGTVSRFRPSVTMSRDMLSYEPGEIQRFRPGLARLRLELLRLAQNQSLRRADGAVFLTRHAADTIQRSCGALANIALIPHGVGDDFKTIRRDRNWPADRERPIRAVYVSAAALYKHQWLVVRAFAELRQRGFNVFLELVGGGHGRAEQLVAAEIASLDPGGEFIVRKPFVPHQALPELLAGADLFVFASSCENMPNTLVEAMAVGLPIACSNRGPMPEILRDAGAYFDPEDPPSIAAAVERIIADDAFRERIAARAREFSGEYSWERCAFQTWKFLVQTLDRATSAERSE